MADAPSATATAGSGRNARHLLGLEGMTPAALMLLLSRLRPPRKIRDAV